MDLLVNYSSSEETQPQQKTKKRKRKKTKETSKKKKKSPTPPSSLPSSLPSPLLTPLPSLSQKEDKYLSHISFPITFTDYPRVFHQITHSALSLSSSSSSSLSIPSSLTTTTGDIWTTLPLPHVSLSRPFTLQKQQIHAFVDCFQSFLPVFSSPLLVFSFSKWKYFKGGKGGEGGKEEGGKTFLGVATKEGQEKGEEGEEEEEEEQQQQQDNFLQAVEATNAVLERFGKQKYFHNPQQHVSIMSINKEMEEKEGELVREGGAVVGTTGCIRCTIGHVVYEIPLRDRKES